MSELPPIRFRSEATCRTRKPPVHEAVPIALPPNEKQGESNAWMGRLVATTRDPAKVFKLTGLSFHKLT
jgi:hypothetical protein